MPTVIVRVTFFVKSEERGTRKELPKLQVFQPGEKPDGTTQGDHTVTLHIIIMMMIMIIMIII